MKAKAKLSTVSTAYRTTAAPFTVATTFGKPPVKTDLSSEVENLATGKWYDCNDSWVKQISGPDTDSASAYVLFYVQTSEL